MCDDSINQPPFQHNNKKKPQNSIASDKIQTLYTESLHLRDAHEHSRSRKSTSIHLNLSSTPMENESSIANDRKQIKIFSNHRILASLVLLMLYFLSAFIWWNAREISFIVKLMISLVNLEGLFDGLFTSTHAQRGRGKLTNDDDEKFVRAIHFCKVFFSSFLTVRHYIDVHRVRTHAHTKWVKYLVSIFGQCGKVPPRDLKGAFLHFRLSLSKIHDGGDNNGEDEFGGKHKMIATNTTRARVSLWVWVCVSQFVTNY